MVARPLSGDQMSTLRELERMLAARFDADNLAIYGDYLQSIDDPRGELIALDLGGDETTRARSEALLAEWLGDGVVQLLGMTEIEHGFVTDLYLDGGDPRSARLLDAMLAGPAAGYLRGATILGDLGWTRYAVERLVTRPHAWLERLSIQAIGRPASPTIGAELAASLAAATPRLAQLEVWGHRVVGELSHDALRSLCVTGYDAVGTLLGRGTARLPSVALLDLAFHVERDRSTVDRVALASLLAPERLPALRRLDLSRNEPGTQAPHYLGGSVPTFALLSALAIRAQLTHVRAPSVRSQADADHIARAISGMPRLLELAIVRGYHRIQGWHMPLAVKLPTPWPWPPADHADSQLTAHWLSDTTDTASADYLRLPLAPLIVWLEDQFTRLSPRARAAWGEFFDLVSDYRGLRITVPGPTIRAALAALDDGDDTLVAWLRLRAMLPSRSPEAGVTFTEL